MTQPGRLAGRCGKLLVRRRGKLLVRRRGRLLVGHESLDIPFGKWPFRLADFCFGFGSLGVRLGGFRCLVP
jgi:hypothetical protein